MLQGYFLRYVAVWLDTSLQSCMIWCFQGSTRVYPSMVPGELIFYKLCYLLYVASLTGRGVKLLERLFRNHCPVRGTPYMPSPWQLSRWTGCLKVSTSAAWGEGVRRLSMHLLQAAKCHSGSLQKICGFSVDKHSTPSTCSLAGAELSYKWVLCAYGAKLASTSALCPEILAGSTH